MGQSLDDDMNRRHFLAGTLRVAFARQAFVAVAAAFVLAAAACDANVPDKPEAAAALSKAIDSTLTRTLPSSPYCKTANPDFTFANLGQLDLVEMLQQLIDKDPLRDATAAGVVRVEATEFRFDPAGRSPDPSCDAVHDRSKQSGLRSGQVRLAVVRAVLTPKGTASGVELDKPIAVATRELVDVTEVRPDRGGAGVTYSWHWKPTTIGEAIGFTPAAPQTATARLRRSNGAWVVEDAGVK
jgi:hypothetical protein